MKRLLLPLVLLAAAGCATSSAFRSGENAERLQDYDRAVLEYQKAVQAAPNDVHVPPGARARAPARRRPTTRTWPGASRGAGSTTRRSRSTASPSSSTRRPRRRRRRRCAISRCAASRARPPCRRPRPGPASGPSPASTSAPRHSSRSASCSAAPACARPTWPSAAPRASTSSSTPPSRTRPISLDLRDVSFEQALNALAAAGRTFHRVVDAKVLNVVPDTPTKRREYEQQVVKTLFLSNADLKETIDLLRVVLGARRVAPVPGRQRPHHQRHAGQGGGRRAHRRHRRQAAGRGRGRGRDPRGRTATRSRSTASSSPRASTRRASTASPAAIFPDPDDQQPRRQSLLQGQPRRHLAARASSTACSRPTPRRACSPTRSCASPRARRPQARFGDQVPVPVTTFTADRQRRACAQQPITSFEYKNVGVNIDITPRVHHDGDVTLQLKLDISAVGAAGLPGAADLQQPHRDYHDPAARRRDEHPRRPHPRRRAPLHAPAPRASRASRSSAGSSPATRTRSQQTDIVMTLTPHIIRRHRAQRGGPALVPRGRRGLALLFEAPPPRVGPPQRPAAARDRAAAASSRSAPRQSPLSSARPPRASRRLSERTSAR